MSTTIEAHLDHPPEPPGAAVPAPAPGSPPPVAPGRGALASAAAGSLAAGAIHAVAVGVHTEHRPAQWAFIVVALFQLGWAAVALARADRPVAVVGIAGHGVVLGAWLLTKTTGIAWIGGLETAEPVGRADGLAALLAAGSILAAGIALAAARRPAPPRAAAGLTVAAVVAAVALGGTGMAATGGVIDSGHGHAGTAAVDHDTAAMDHGNAAMDHGAAGPGAEAAGPAGHGAAPVAPVPYDPTKPIDLGGVPGVSLQQQARAENLIAVTLDRLPHFADPATAEAAGFHSIGDARTGFEHFINYGYIDDDHILNPDFPESLVYAVDKAGKKSLAAAMFMLRNGDTLATVPDVGGPLMQWHVHDNLCFTPDPVAPQVAGVTAGPDGPCRNGLVKGQQVPMIHVWTVPHPCGPFAALDGIGGGTIPTGETRLCDSAHGGHGG